ncbi:LysR family transcriptional regulator [Bradyrhizobium sp. ISRA443]|uniref:LysR family transcriptional regulator n=1 Tax=unclassified Bradyrhizobium TaxID=2631580 RepID=UPI00247A5AD3|nr:MULTISPECIES: LysR family transcriptional regulator [unclassified Bradyrhizobium]WGR98814.1 LysR family transcriptional regulator [Bradyrhizobium sp. ISRA436]WGS05705.1 LysR family transcriptional regulator [Bradyrhizobium sp. ISRA437]WGS12591.1 LysR family transcriptional regulator [Bradyrhizobium sp. ISRA443]
MRINPSDLATFLAIARHKSFRAAATELGVSASALSHALRNIEERLDLRLINRTTRSVALTEAGERLFARISPAFRDIDDALEDLNNFRGRPVGTLRFTAARQSAQLVLLPIVTRFLKAFPDVSVEVMINDALIDMVAAGFDAGVRFGETIAADMIAVPIGPRHRFAVVGSPAYFRTHKPPITPYDLKGLPCIRYRFTSGVVYRWEFERGGIEVDIDVAGPLTLNDQDLMVDAALDGAGLAYVFEAQIDALITKRKLVRVLADWCPAYPGFFLYYPSRRQLPAALRAFVDFARSPNP